MLKRSLSPLIATILLIVVSVILITVVLTWGSDFAKKNLDQAKNHFLEEDSTLKGSLALSSINQSLENNTIIFKNINNYSDLNLIGYRLLSKDSNYVFLEKNFYFENPIYLEKGAIVSTAIVCIPSRSFTMQFITNKNTFIDLPITYNLYNSNNYCLGQEGLVGYWPFDGDTKDFSKYKNHGALNGATFIDLKYDSALSFNEDIDQVVINNLSVDLNPEAKNTVLFWVNWAGVTSDMPIGWISGYDIIFYGTNCFGFNTGNGEAYGAPSNALLNKWTFVSAVFYNGLPSDGVKLYFNGINQNLSICCGTSMRSKSVSQKMFVSGWTESASYTFKGLINDVYVYNRELTAEEILGFYNSTKGKY